MSLIPNWGDGADDDEPEDGVRCRVCGHPDLTLINTGTRYALFEENGHEHICRHRKPDPDDFAPVK